MKLSKTTLLVIAIGIFVVIGTALGMVRSQQVDEQSRLKKELATVQSNLERVQLDALISRKAELEKQLNQATSQYETVKSVLSEPVGCIAASSILFDVAEAYGLEVTELTSSGPASENVKGVTCSVLSLRAKVVGDVPNLVNLVTRLNSSLKSGVVKSATIAVPESASSDNATADIQLVVYVYQGS